MPKGIEQIRDALEEWLRETQGESVLVDSDRVMNLCHDVEVLLDQDDSPQAVHLADKIYGFAGERGLEKRVQLHRMYSRRAPNSDEEFWSWWHLVDTLAVLKRCDEAIEEQVGLYRWASEALTSDHVLYALHDSAQAWCWEVAGRFDEWVALYYKALALVNELQVPRRTRCFFLRTGAEVLARKGRFEEAYEQVVKLEQVNNEDPQWSDYLTFWCGVITAKLEIFRGKHQWTEYDDTAQEALTFLDEKFTTEKLTDRERKSVCYVAHDVGACLMWAKRYDQARTLLEFVVERQGEASASTHLFLAACIWRAQKDREVALRHLRIAQNTTRGNFLMRGRYRQFFLEMEEFADVWSDPEFLAAVSET